ncbi:hypothetical protein ACXZ1M_22600 [Duganella sp. PWIR1]
MINITRRGWQHILRHHTGTQFTRHKSKSKFYSTINLVDLINQAACCPPSTCKDKLQRIFDAGYAVGIDRNTGKPTSIVSVFTRLNGDLITMFPGR